MCGLGVEGGVGEDGLMPETVWQQRSFVIRIAALTSCMFLFLKLWICPKFGAAAQKDVMPFLAYFHKRVYNCAKKENVHI